MLLMKAFIPPPRLRYLVITRLAPVQVQPRPTRRSERPLARTKIRIVFCQGHCWSKPIGIV
jgi:hypothetical protein